jgi:hypothetical protein
MIQIIYYRENGEIDTIVSYKNGGFQYIRINKENINRYGNNGIATIHDIISANL